MKRCPRCYQLMPTDDPLEAMWVALGEAVCGFECHQETYSLYAPRYFQPLRNGQLEKHKSLVERWRHPRETVFTMKGGDPVLGRLE